MGERGIREAVLVALIATLGGCGAGKETTGGGLDVDSADGDADADADADADGDADGDGDGDGDGDSDGDSDADIEPPGGDGDADEDPPPGLEGGETCADAVQLDLGAEIEGDTTGAANDYEDDCVTSDGPEIAYAFEPDTNGRLVVDLEAVPDADDNRWDTVLYLRGDCGDGDLACNDDWDVDDDGDVNVGWSHLERCVEAGNEYRILIDGFSPDHYGAFLMRTDLQACADGEECIDGECRAPDGGGGDEE